VELERVEFAQPALLDQANVAIKAGGILAVSWDHAEGENGNADDLLFHLHLRAKTNSGLRSAFAITNIRLSPEAYRIENEDRAALALRFGTEPLNTQNLDLDIFPNPSSGDFYVLNPFSEAFAQLRVLDLNGTTLWEKSGSLPRQIEVQNQGSIQPGIYFVELKSATQTRLGKLVVVN
jgi:hypothetical protein